jgi:hypothetical protein
VTSCDGIVWGPGEEEGGDWGGGAICRVELVGVAEGESGPLFCVRLMRVDPARSWKGGLWMGLIPGLDHVSLLVFTFFFCSYCF